MRARALLMLALFTATAGFAQQNPPAPAGPPPRYGVEVTPRFFPQSTPAEALASATRAADKGRYDYLAAHLLEPKFVDDRVAARGKLLAASVEQELRTARDLQRRDTTLQPRERLPAEPIAFAAAVAEETRKRAFIKVVEDIRAHLAESPETVRELRRFAREGPPVEAGDTASVALKADPKKQVSFARRGERWFVENKQAAAAEAK